MSRGAIRVQGRTEIDRVICDAGPMAAARCEVQRLTTEDVLLPEGWLEAPDPFGRRSRFDGSVIQLHLCRACQLDIPGREGVDSRDHSWEFVRLPDEEEQGGVSSEAALWRHSPEGDMRWMLPDEERERELVRP